MHVDDFGIAATSMALKKEIMEAIQDVCRCVASDLGMQLVRDRVRRTITVTQPGYMKDLREKY